MIFEGPLQAESRSDGAAEICAAARCGGGVSAAPAAQRQPELRPLHPVLECDVPDQLDRVSVFAVLVIVGCVNAVNLTDGIDGLASGVTIPVMVFFAVFASMWGTESGSSALALLPASLAGGLAGFLIYNFHPAKVFMGDTGSLFLGAAVCGMAFALDMPLVLILVGLVYIVETLSVMMQVTYFKLTHGKRIFRMTPIHHHFELGGWSEIKIWTVFVAVTCVMCILAGIGVMNRF